MKLIDLKAIPNQKFTIIEDGHQYDIRIFTLSHTNDMAIDVEIDGVAVASGFKIVPNLALLYKHFQAGNFLMTTKNDELINYELFGVTQFLYYIPVSEL